MEDHEEEEAAAKVFCVQQPRSNDRDLSSANRYGKIFFLLDDSDSPSITPSACLHKMNKHLMEYEHTDFLFYAGGDPLALALAIALLKDKGFTEINLLRWERSRSITGERTQGVGFYVPVRVKLKY